MKRAVLVTVLVLAAGTAFGQEAIGTAISGAVNDISWRVPAASRIAVINVASEHQRLSDHIINGLMTGLVNAGFSQVVPRGTVELEAARAEFQFQMSDYVSPATQASVGRFLGAQTIVTGTVVRGVGNTHRLTVSAINLEGFVMLSSFTVYIRDDHQTRTIIAGQDVTIQWTQQRDRVRRERFRTGALNMVFGIGSAFDERPGGWFLYICHAINIFVAVLGGIGRATEGDPSFLLVNAYIYGGLAVIGWITPLWRVSGPGPRPPGVAYSGLPFDVALVSSNQRDITGVTVSRTVRLGGANSADRRRR